MINRPDYYYNAPHETFEKAKLLRKEMTSAEKVVWKIIRRNNLKGFYFRRQHPVWIYIADFYCHKARLVVELDGEVHDTENAKQYDAGRNEKMNDFGITVLRFKNEDVFANIDFVVETIEKHLR